VFLYHVCGQRRVRAVYARIAVTGTYRKELRNVTGPAGRGDRCALLFYLLQYSLTTVQVRL
jgi:hypothetical protein